jgi:hypothetical protein
MRYEPDDIADSDLQVALDPSIGGENKVYASFEPVVVAGLITQPAAASGVLTIESTFDNTGGGTARDFQVVVDKTGARSEAEIAITLAVTFADDTNGLAVATFEIPDRSPNQMFSIGQGTAVDLVGTGGNSAKKIKRIISVNTVVGGAANNRFRIVAYPEEATFFLIGCTNEANLTLPVSKSLPIPCGLNGSAFVKSGRSDPGTLTVTEKYVDYMAGLGRVNGHFATAMVVCFKDERIVTERIVVGKWKPMASPQIGDGDDIVTQQAQGNFETFAIFTAK